MQHSNRLAIMYRFDDICPTMNWRMWDRIEAILDRTGCCAILAIVPDNRDPKLMVDPPNAQFWRRAREWQDKGFVIGLHGYQHLAVTQGTSLVPIHRHGEFLGTEFGEQYDKIKNALAICSSENVFPSMWVAPRHAFNHVTLDVLAAHGMTVISDGYGFRPVVDRRGFVWLPQQLGAPRPIPRVGTWTICLHPNMMGDQHIAVLEEHMDRYRHWSNPEELQGLIESAKRETLGDRIVGTALINLAKFKRILARR